MRSADKKTPEGTWSVAIDTDAEHRYRCLRSMPLQARLPYRLRYGYGNRFIHEFRDSGSNRRRSIHRPSTMSAGDGLAASGGILGTTKRPKEPRSLDAPINVNTDQIARCSWPLRARPTIRCAPSPRQGGYPRDSSQTHRFRGRCPHAAHTYVSSGHVTASVSSGRPSSSTVSRSSSEPSVSPRRQAWSSVRSTFQRAGRGSS